MVKYFRKSFSVSDLWVSSSDRLSDFYASSWQRGDSAVPLLVVRLVLAVVALGIMVWAVTEAPTPYFLIYLTNWGLLLLNAMTLSALLVSMCAICKWIPDEGEMPWYVSMYWLLYNVSVSIAFVITALYWILLYDSSAVTEDADSRRAFWLDLSTHGLNSCIVFLELMVSRTPVHILHVYQPLGVGLWYAAFTGIYYAAGGTDVNGNPFIYEILDWSKPSQTGIVVSASTAGLIVIYLVICGLAFCRDKATGALIRTTSHDLPYTPPDPLTRVV